MSVLDSRGVPLLGGPLDESLPARQDAECPEPSRPGSCPMEPQRPEPAIPGLASSGVRPARLAGTAWGKVAAIRRLYALLERMAARLGSLGLSAITITGLALLAALGAGVMAAWGHPGWAAVLFLGSGGLDLLDGAVARATGSSTRWGALLDSTLDRIADAAPLIGLAVFYAERVWTLLLPLVVLVNGFSISYVRARVENLGAELPELPMRRAPRVLLLTFSLLLGIPSSSTSTPRPLMLVGLGLLALLTTAGVIAALGAARRVLSQGQTSPAAIQPQRTRGFDDSSTTRR